MIESVTKQLNIMIKKTIIIHSSCDNIWYVNTAHSQSPLVDSCKVKEKEIFSFFKFWKVW
jgi:hypothetical protein